MPSPAAGRTPFPGSFLSILLTGMALAGCAPSPFPPSLPERPVQSIYRNGVPHTNRQGHGMLAYEAGRSFLPVGIYHGLQGRHFGREYKMSDLAAAGFNTAHLWPEQDVIAAVAAAGENGMQAIVQHPSDSQIAALAANPAVLAWLGEDEPGESVAPEDVEARILAFEALRTRIHARDQLDRPVFIMEAAGISPKQEPAWRKWIVRGDVAVHFNYPFARQFEPVRSISRVALSVRRAVLLNGERKPVWFVYQAFAGNRGWFMPQPNQMRAMVYAALVHGATGFIAFGLDSYAMRDGGVVGIAPDPAESYGETPDFDRDGKPPLAVDPEQVEHSRHLWRAATDLNRELQVLAPVILSSTAAISFDIAFDGEAMSPMPIRALLKRDGEGRYVLIAVNLDNVPLDVHFRFPRAVASVARRFEEDADIARDGMDAWRDRFPPFGVRIYHVSMAGAE